MQEVAARGGQVILVTDETGASAHAADAFETIAVPEADPFISPMIYAVPMQLLAYHAAVFIGRKELLECGLNDFDRHFGDICNARNCCVYKPF